jgi:hypothetical protein
MIKISPFQLLLLDEAIFGLLCCQSVQLCVHLHKGEPHTTAEEVVNFTWITLNCGMSSRRITVLFFTEAIMTGTSYS